MLKIAKYITFFCAFKFRNSKLKRFLIQNMLVHLVPILIKSITNVTSVPISHMTKPLNVKSSIKIFNLKCKQFNVKKIRKKSKGK